jgi:hypothetical protein
MGFGGMYGLILPLSLTSIIWPWTPLKLAAAVSRIATMLTFITSISVVFYELQIFVGKLPTKMTMSRRDSKPLPMIQYCVQDILIRTSSPRTSLFCDAQHAYLKFSPYEVANLGTIVPGSRI